MSLVRAGIRVEHDDTMVDVPVGDKDFVRLGIHGHVAWIAEECGVLAATGPPELTDLQEELPGARELEYDMPISGDPYVVLVVDVDSMFGG
jgi:hypothetical protein